jgi:hypothetical protein
MEPCQLYPGKRRFQTVQRYSQPWNPQKFLKGKQVTYPYQHESVIFYRAEPVSSFWGEKSILRKGYIEASNGFYTNGGKNGGGNEITAKSHGVFGGFLKTTEYYARGDTPDPVLKLEVPAPDTVTIYVPEEERKKRGRHGDPETGSLRNLNEINKYFGSPENMRQVCLNSIENREGFGGYEYVMFMVPHEVPVRPGENWIKGVWDKDFYDRPHFEPLEKYVKTLKSRHPKAVPDGIEPDHIKEEIKRELHDLEKIRKMVSRMDKCLKFDRKQLKVTQASQLPERKREYLENSLERYEEILENLHEFIRQEFDTKEREPKIRINSVAQINQEAMGNLKKEFQELEEEVQKIHDEEHRHGQEISKNGGSAKEFRKETEYEEKTEKRVADDISALPSFRPLIEKL